MGRGILWIGLLLGTLAGGCAGNIVGTVMHPITQGGFGSYFFFPLGQERQGRNYQRRSWMMLNQGQKHYSFA